MAYAGIGGFAAPLGLWSGVVPTIVGSVFARTALMVTTLTILVGVVMLLMRLLKLGSVMSFVSTAVMTGFTTGIALQIVTGVLKDATGSSNDRVPSAVGGRGTRPLIRSPFLS